MPAKLSVNLNAIAMLRNRVPNIDKAIISVHCHNESHLSRKSCSQL